MAELDVLHVQAWVFLLVLFAMEVVKELVIQQLLDNACLAMQQEDEDAFNAMQVVTSSVRPAILLEI